MLRAALAALLVLLLSPAIAGAYVVQERGGLASFTNGIAFGPDGNFWVSEAGNGTVARVTPAGQVLQRFPVGASPTTVATGPGGRVWITVTGADQLAWIDALAPAPSTHFIPTPTDCGPAAIVAGGDGKMYFSTPQAGGCAAASRIGSVNDDGSGAATSVPGLGKAFDLEVAGGKLFVPDLDGDQVRRVALGTLAAETTVTFPAGSGPDGVAVDNAGRIWVTLYLAGGVASFPATQSGGLATVLPSGGLVNPFGIVAAPDGRLYLAAQGSAELGRIDPATGALTRYGVPGGQPFQIVNGPDGDLWFTDTANPRILRFVNSAPRAVTGEARALATTAGSAGASVDPRGNTTQVVFDVGTTTAYGTTTAPVTVPEGAGAVDVRTDLPDLAPGTTYHLRVRASNAEGQSIGADTTLTTPAEPPRPLRASVSFRWAYGSAFTQLTRVLVRDLLGTERIALTCKGRGCGVRSKSLKAKRGSAKLTKYFGRKRRLRPGTRVGLRITAPNAIGSVVTLTVRKAKEPLITRRCLPPGATKPRKRC